MPCFHSTLRGISGQTSQSDPVRLDGLPDVDVRVPEHQHELPARAAGDLLGDPGLLAPRHQMIDQHTEPPAAFRGELGDDPGQVVHAAEVLDHHADMAQVVAPDLLDQFGVVPALDVDPAGQRHLRPFGRRGDRAGGGPASDESWRGAGAISFTGLPSWWKPGPSGKLRRRRWRSSRTTRPFSQRITAPQKPLVGSSTTSPGAITRSVLMILFRRCQPPARTSVR